MFHERFNHFKDNRQHSMVQCTVILGRCNFNWQLIGACSMVCANNYSMWSMWRQMNGHHIHMGFISSLCCNQNPFLCQETTQQLRYPLPMMGGTTSKQTIDAHITHILKFWYEQYIENFCKQKLFSLTLAHFCNFCQLCQNNNYLHVLTCCFNKIINNLCTHKHNKVVYVIVHTL